MARVDAEERKRGGVKMNQRDGVKGTAKRRREGGTERMKENLLARAWQDRSNIYTYVAREINITL